MIGFALFQAGRGLIRVEDEPSLLEMVAGMLEMLGYQMLPVAQQEDLKGENSKRD